jgi:hypothetical protein
MTNPVLSWNVVSLPRSRRLELSVFAVAASFFWFQPALAQLSQQGPKLVGTGDVGKALQGYAVSLSADGNTAILGGYYDAGSTGAAWVFTRRNGLWDQQGEKLVGTGSVYQPQLGYSVALSTDGNTALIGGHNDDYSRGATWVFTRSGGVWAQQGPKLVGSGATVGYASYQGTSVSLSADGNTAIEGGYGDNHRVGAVWVFTRSGGVWTQQGDKLVGTGATGVASQGISVAISADGNTALVGGSKDDSGRGAAWVLTRSGGTWRQQGGKLVGTGATGAAAQGTSVSLSPDGNTAIIGGPDDNGSAGAAWIFTRSGTAWTQQGSKLIGTGAVGAANQGRSVSLSSDGNTAVIGGPYDNGFIGAARMFTRSGGEWTQQGLKLAGSRAVGQSYQSFSVALSGDAHTAIAGGWTDDNNNGAAWVYSTQQSGPTNPGISCWYNASGAFTNSDTSYGTVGSIDRTGSGDYAAGYIISAYNGSACPRSLPSTALRGKTAYIVRRDFSNCTNDDVKASPSTVGGAVSVFRLRDNTAVSVVRLFGVSPGINYQFFHKCDRELGMIASDARGFGSASFPIGVGTSESVLTFDMYPQGAPAGNKFQSVKMSF